MRSHSRRSFIQFSGKPLVTANSSNVIQHIQSDALSRLSAPLLGHRTESRCAGLISALLTMFRVGVRHDGCIAANGCCTRVQAHPAAGVEIYAEPMRARLT